MTLVLQLLWTKEGEVKQDSVVDFPILPSRIPK